MPAKAGIQSLTHGIALVPLDPRFRGDDEEKMAIQLETITL
jgi:hypothetical protein